MLIKIIIIIVGIFLTLYIAKNPKTSLSDTRLTCPQDIPEFVTEKGEFGSIGERYMTSCFENIYKIKFKKIRPEWLKNPKTGRSLELDCYNQDVSIAGEYNGRQHYEFVEHFHSTQENFKKQKERDEIKQALCTVYGIRLILVPYTVKQKDMQKYIYDQLTQFQF